MTTTDIPALDEAKLEAFVGQVVVDMGSAISGLLLHLGDRLGLYKAMADAGPITSATLAEGTGTAERYVREWLANQTAGGYVVYDPTAGTYELPAEHAMVVANEDSPVFLAGAFETIASCYADHDMFVDAFRTGAGIGWHAHDHRLFSGIVRLFRPGYAAHLVDEWLPALDGVVDKLRAGASPMSAAGTGRRPSSWPRHSGTRRSPASTSTTRRSGPPVQPQQRPACIRARPSTSPPPRTSPAMATTWSACSTPCTIWAIRSARPATSVRPWHRTAPCCWSNPTPAMPWSRT
jgi:hypothetical protein